jgi:ferrous iron transport protein A
MKHDKETHTMPLSHVSAGKTVKVVAIEAGHSLKSRLASLGVMTNSILHIQRNAGAGQLIVAIKNSKVVLGRGASGKIIVTEA